MITEKDIADLIRRLAKARGWSVSHASRVVTGSGDTVARIDVGIGLTMRRGKGIIEAVSREWPAGTAWPAGIERPSADQQKAAS